MNIKTISKESFCVIGKEGSTKEGATFIATLWEDANAHFQEVAHLAVKKETGGIQGIWGAMTDFSRGFMPWENGFREGLYLAGVECSMDAEAPQGWVKWIIPGFTYLCIPNHSGNAFGEMIAYLKEQNLPLVGAVQEYTDPDSGETELWFPIQRDA